MTGIYPTADLGERGFDMETVRTLNVGGLSVVSPFDSPRDRAAVQCDAAGHFNPKDVT
jgi:hypothetical protein